ncbi:MAG TPA: bifunctional phosphopantothenoylcysteine decarboxylase/phosphopantothenate--cysteine ligase CoaBC [Candidatus Thermoplasmatota archaeon]|nr:bifunctional phosphopantothenoylcysteine decarboxylase/phosphopantothenate--cysteine ligase CoaBC [Candidatus Thermoplasmatota archaeon]
MHPADRLRGSTSSHLAGKRIVLGVTGSIAAVKSVEVARELIRHGADVVPVMTRAATRILHPDALEFATGHAPVLELTGATEHVRDADADLLVVAPATGNTVAKLALGIDDTTVTTYFTARREKRRTIVAPAMHETMWESPPLQARLAELRAMGVTVLDPFFEEGKAKLPEPDAIVEHVLRALGPGTLAGKRVLVVNGSTLEPLDDMRVVTNRSSGRMGVALARGAWRLGADVEMWFGHGHVEHPRHLPTRRFVTIADLQALAPEAARFDAVLVPAAISDYGPARSEGKIPSEKGALELRLAPLPKFLVALRRHFRGVLVPFKAESGLPHAELVQRARRSLEANDAAFVVANDLGEVALDSTSALLVDRATAVPVSGTKDEVAAAVLARLAQELRRS